MRVVVLQGFYCTLIWKNKSRFANAISRVEQSFDISHKYLGHVSYNYLSDEVD